MPVNLSHNPSLRVSPTSASPSWTPCPGLQDMSRRPALGALESGRREGGVGSGDAPSPEPGPSTGPQPLDSVGGAGRELGRSGGPSPGPGAGHPGGVNEPQARICVTGNTSPLRLLCSVISVPSGHPGTKQMPATKMMPSPASKQLNLLEILSS